MGACVLRCPLGPGHEAFDARQAQRAIVPARAAQAAHEDAAARTRPDRDVGRMDRASSAQHPSQGVCRDSGASGRNAAADGTEGFAGRELSFLISPIQFNLPRRTRSGTTHSSAPKMARTRLFLFVRDSSASSGTKPSVSQGLEYRWFRFLFTQISES